MREQLTDWISEYIQTQTTAGQCTTVWEKPLVAIASAQDPLFWQLQEIISPDYFLPGELLEGAQSVIAYYLPFSADINRSNLRNRWSSPEWSQAYLDTNKLIGSLNQYLADQLKALNYRTALIPATHNFDPQRLISRWSHKHVAYIAGLGKFGLNHLLITAKVCNGRLGSLVTDLPLEPTPRPPEEFCLHKYNGSCGLCITRCPQEVLGKPRYNRHKCYELCLENATRYQELGLADVCGKCVAEVPCSYAAPALALSRRKP